MACSMSVAPRAGSCGGCAAVDTDWNAVVCTVWMCIVGSCGKDQRIYFGKISAFTNTHDSCSYKPTNAEN
jgi:hypothetical protein